MSGVLLREEPWEPLYAERGHARLACCRSRRSPTAIATPEYLDWVDTEEKRRGMIDELPIAAVLIFRFWREQRPRRAQPRRSAAPSGAQAGHKGRQRLH